MPYTEETKTVRKLTSDLTGVTREVDETPEPYKWPAAKDMPKLYVHTDEADALTAFLNGDPEPLKALLTVKPASNGSKGKSTNPLLASVREWAKANGVDAAEARRVSTDTYTAYFKANPDATLPDGVPAEAAKGYALAHPAAS
jgi:hypothetical protein